MEDHPADRYHRLLAALVQEGKSLAEVKAALAASDSPARPGGRRWPSLVEIIYHELTKNK